MKKTFSLMFALILLTSCTSKDENTGSMPQNESSNHTNSVLEESNTVEFKEENYFLKETEQGELSSLFQLYYTQDDGIEIEIADLGNSKQYIIFNNRIYYINEDSWGLSGPIFAQLESVDLQGNDKRVLDTGSVEMYWTAFGLVKDGALYCNGEDRTDLQDTKRGQYKIAEDLSGYEKHVDLPYERDIILWDDMELDMEENLAEVLCYFTWAITWEYTDSKRILTQDEIVGGVFYNSAIVFANEPEIDSWFNEEEELYYVPRDRYEEIVQKTIPNAFIDDKFERYDKESGCYVAGSIANNSALYVEIIASEKLEKHETMQLIGDFELPDDSVIYRVQCKHENKYGDNRGPFEVVFSPHENGIYFLSNTYLGD